VKLHVGADESTPGLIGFMKNLREHPNLWLLDAVGDKNGSVEISISIKAPFALVEALEEMEQVSQVNVSDGLLKVRLAEIG